MDTTRRRFLVQAGALAGLGAFTLGARRPRPVRSGVLRLPGGRELEYLAGGPKHGTALLLHHGTPSCDRLYTSWLDDVAALGLALVAYSRPGYGDSTRLPGRDVAQAATDVAALLDHLGHEAFVTAGWSGGGPHALACAALLPKRCRAAATLSGVAPYGAKDLDFLGGMGQDNIDEFGQALKGKAALTAWIEKNGAPLRTITEEQVVQAFGDLLSGVDRAALTGSFAQTMANETRWALHGGFGGWIDDDLAFVKPWGFDLGTIGVPVSVWQGAQDRMVPQTHGHWLAAHIPGAVGHFDPDQGHLSLVTTHRKAILADLVARAKL